MEEVKGKVERERRKKSRRRPCRLVVLAELSAGHREMGEDDPVSQLTWL